MKFELSEKENRKAEKIIEVLCDTTTHDVTFSYRFTPTGIGNAVDLIAIMRDKETKTVTKISFDITDVSVW